MLTYHRGALKGDPQVRPTARNGVQGVQSDPDRGPLETHMARDLQRFPPNRPFEWRMLGFFLSSLVLILPTLGRMKGGVYGLTGVFESALDLAGPVGALGLGAVSSETQQDCCTAPAPRSPWRS